MTTSIHVLKTLFNISLENKKLLLFNTLVIPIANIILFSFKFNRFSAAFFFLGLIAAEYIIIYSTIKFFLNNENQNTFNWQKFIKITLVMFFMFLILLFIYYIVIIYFKMIKINPHIEPYFFQFLNYFICYLCIIYLILLMKNLQVDDTNKFYLSYESTITELKEKFFSHIIYFILVFIILNALVTLVVYLGIIPSIFGILYEVKLAIENYIKFIFIISVSKNILLKKI